MTDSIALDHIVALVRDPAAAAEGLRALGLEAAAGGRHARWGTHNVLVPLSQAYLEFLGVEDEAIARRSPFGLAVLAGFARGEGLWRVALRTSDMRATLDGLRLRGIACTGPTPGVRVRPDGTSLRWQLAFPRGPEDGGIPPMLIAWDDPGSAPHDRPDGAQVAELAIRARDPGRVAHWYEKAFALSSEPIEHARYGPARRIALAGGDLVFCAGGGDGAGQHPPGPFALALRAGACSAADEVRIGPASFVRAT